MIAETNTKIEWKDSGMDCDWNYFDAGHWYLLDEAPFRWMVVDLSNQTFRNTSDWGSLNSVNQIFDWLNLNSVNRVGTISNQLIQSAEQAMTQAMIADRIGFESFWKYTTPEFDAEYKQLSEEDQEVLFLFTSWEFDRQTNKAIYIGQN